MNLFTFRIFLENSELSLFNICLVNLFIFEILPKNLEFSKFSLFNVFSEFVWFWNFPGKVRTLTFLK